MPWERIRIETLSDGRQVVIKRATTAAQREAMRRESETLTALDHPGVVALVEHRLDTDFDELVTEHAGAATFADHKVAHPIAAVGVIAAVAAIVADLHRGRIGHGNLAADHVVLGARRHPILCSFGAAGALTDQLRRRDLESLADMVDRLLAYEDQDIGRLTRAQRRHLAGVSDACRSGDGGAADVAAKLAATPGQGAAARTTGEPSGPGATEATTGTRAWRDRVPARPSAIAVPNRTALVVMGCLIALGAVVAAGVSTRGTSSASTLLTPAPAATSAATPSPTVEDVPAPAAATPATAIETPSCPTPSTAPLDLDGDGCGDEVLVIGHLVSVDGRWFSAGEPGDQVVVGDWDCDGRATAAVLRPDTGDLFLFPHWVDDAALTVPSSRQIAGAVQLTAFPAGTCHELGLLDASGDLLDHGLGT